MDKLSTMLFPTDTQQGRYAIGNRKMLELLNNQYERLDRISIGKDIVYGWRIVWKTDDKEITDYIYCRSYDLDEGIQIAPYILENYDIESDLITDVTVGLYGFRRITHLVVDADIHYARDMDSLDTLLQNLIESSYPILVTGTHLSVFDNKSGRIVRFTVKNIFIQNGVETLRGFAMDSEYSVDIQVPSGINHEAFSIKSESPPKVEEPPTVEEPPSVEPGYVLNTESQPKVLTPQELREARLKYFSTPRS